MGIGQGNGVIEQLVRRFREVPAPCHETRRPSPFEVHDINPSLHLKKWWSQQHKTGDRALQSMDALNVDSERVLKACRRFLMEGASYDRHLTALLAKHSQLSSSDTSDLFASTTGRPFNGQLGWNNAEERSNGQSLHPKLFETLEAPMTYLNPLEYFKKLCVVDRASNMALGSKPTVSYHPPKPAATPALSEKENINEVTSRRATEHQSVSEVSASLLSLESSEETSPKMMDVQTLPVCIPIMMKDDIDSPQSLDAIVSDLIEGIVQSKLVTSSMTNF